MNILAVGAHPDDIDTCCGGTLIRYAQAGARVVIAVMTDGRASPRGNPVTTAALRREEAQAAATLIGAELIWMGFPDGQMMDSLEARLQLCEVMMRVAPDLIITESPEDYHSDHIVTSQMVTAVSQMASWSPPPQAPGNPLGKAVPVAFMTSTKGIGFLPEDYVDVSAVWQTKFRMVQCHLSQYLPGPVYSADQVKEPFDQYGLLRFTRIMDEYYGLCCGVNYAEAFRWWRAADRLVPRRLLP
jgi:N-acetylglucosamine malate deacetylase 1